jgi:DNA polymerase-3 subunit delta'
VSDSARATDSADSQWPQPRENPDLVGHQAAEQALWAAYHGGRLGHAWLIAGPRGIGKATLAFRFARYLLASPGPSTEEGGRSADLGVDPDHPVFRRVAGGSHGDLMTVERTANEKTGRMRGEITVLDARRLPRFFATTAAEGGWRVAVVDCVEEMNRHAANALLKTLEEPPRNTLILLISHSPDGILPTLRSRCRMLPLRPLDEADMCALMAVRFPEFAEADTLALARLSNGSPGRAFPLAAAGGLEVYRDMVTLLGSLPRIDGAALHRFADRFAREANAELYRAMRELLLAWIARMVREAAAETSGEDIVPGERALMQRLSARRGLDPWLEVWENIGRLFVQADSVKLDKKQVVMSAFTTLEKAARG